MNYVSSFSRLFDRPTKTSWTGNYGAKLFLGSKLAFPDRPDRPAGALERCEVIGGVGCNSGRGGWGGWKGALTSRSIACVCSLDAVAAMSPL